MLASPHAVITGYLEKVSKKQRQFFDPLRYPPMASFLEVERWRWGTKVRAGGEDQKAVAMVIKDTMGRMAMGRVSCGDDHQAIR